MKPVLLECIYLGGNYPWLGLKFVNGQATVTDPVQLEKIKKTTGWGREFGIWGQLHHAATPNPVQVVKGEPALTAEQLKKLLSVAEASGDVEPKSSIELAT